MVIITIIIIGAKWPGQLQDNLAAVEIRLTDKEIKQLDQVSA
jgi:aryl-alcohol dehydrogenase-like predicted oxidoreductase